MMQSLRAEQVTPRLAEAAAITLQPLGVRGTSLVGSQVSLWGGEDATPAPLVPDEDNEHLLSTNSGLCIIRQICHMLSNLHNHLKG